MSGVKTATKFELVEISKLVPYANNARTHNKAQITKLRSSLREYGFVSPVIIDENYNILCGHGRISAAKEEGITQAPCVFVEHLTEAQKKGYILADNRFALDAGWDEDMLKIEMEGLKDMGFDLSLTGFDDIEIGKMFESSEEAKEDDFDVDAELQKPAITHPGDIWMLGDHRLYCGDSTNEAHVLALMNGIQADLLLTDPPYNVDYEGKTKEKLKIQNDKMQNDSFREFLTLAFKNAYKAMKPGAVFYICHADSEGYNFRGACIDAELNVKQCLIWNKNTMVMGRQDYQWKHEPILYGWKEGAGHLWASDRKQVTVIDIDRPSRSTLHPTMKPVALFDYLTKNNTKGGDVVLDLFGGSGTTLISCEQDGRRGYLMELDPKYCDVIVNRYIELVGGSATVSVLREGVKKSYDEAAGEVK